jgi:hypothetical protein
VGVAGSHLELGITERSFHFRGMAGNRLSVLLAGSTLMPTDSRAVTPRSGSQSGSPKMTLPAVISPMNWMRGIGVGIETGLRGIRFGGQGRGASLVPRRSGGRNLTREDTEKRGSIEGEMKYPRLLAEK